MILNIVVIVVCVASVLFNLLVPRHRAVDLVYRTSAVKLKGLRDEVKYDRIEAEKSRNMVVQLANQSQYAMSDAAEALRLSESVLSWAEELHKRAEVPNKVEPEPEPEPRRIGAYFQ